MRACGDAVRFAGVWFRCGNLVKREGEGGETDNCQR